MKLLFVQEAVYLEYQGNLYSGRIEYGKYWERYLKNFSAVNILARARQVTELPPGYKRSTGHRVSYISLPFYNGPFQYIKKKKEIKEIIKKAVKNHDAFVIRVPGPLGALAMSACKKEGLKFVVEVVGDPYEVGQHLPLIWPLKMIYRYFSYVEMKQIVKKASAALYVTENTLQRRYPPGKYAFHCFASNVIISNDELISNIEERLLKLNTLPLRLKTPNQERVQIGVVGMLYSIKSPLEIVRCAKILIDSGLNIQINFVGDGPMIANIHELSKELNIQDRIVCFGALPGGVEVFKFLDSIDLYLQFSKTEGLPRSMIEAMARGCPVIASNVGGIPEIISKDLLVKSGDYISLSQKINAFLNNPVRIEIAVKANIEKAKSFLDRELSIKRSNFYLKVQEMYNNKKD